MAINMIIEVKNVCDVCMTQMFFVLSKLCTGRLEQSFRQDNEFWKDKSAIRCSILALKSDQLLLTAHEFLRRLDIKSSDHFSSLAQNAPDVVVS